MADFFQQGYQLTQVHQASYIIYILYSQIVAQIKNMMGEISNNVKIIEQKHGQTLTDVYGGKREFSTRSCCILPV